MLKHSKEEMTLYESTGTLCAMSDNTPVMAVPNASLTSFWVLEFRNFSLDRVCLNCPITQGLYIATLIRVQVWWHLYPKIAVQVGQAMVLA